MLYFLLGLLSACQVPNTEEEEPAGQINFSGAAVNEQDAVRGVETRDGREAILSLNLEASNYHAERGRGYEWSIVSVTDEQELSALVLARDRFQLLALNTPPMSRMVIVGQGIPSGKYQVLLSIYTSKTKVGERDSLLQKYIREFYLYN